MNEARIEAVAQGVRKLESLLKGEPQAKPVRSLLGIEAEGSYPLAKEYPRFVTLPDEITNRLARITAETGKDGREREVYIGEKEGKYLFSRTYKGDKHSVGEKHRDDFPKEDLGTVLLETHTHPKRPPDSTSSISPQDITALTYQYHVPGWAISHDKGLWMLIKSGEFYQQFSEPDRIFNNAYSILSTLREIDDDNRGRSLEFYLHEVALIAKKFNMVFYYHLEYSPGSHIKELSEGNYVMMRGDPPKL